MKRDRFFFFLIFATSFLLPLSCAYACYNDIVEADFLTLETKYEAADMEDLAFDKQNLTGVIFHPLSTFLFLEDNFFGALPGSFLSMPLIHPISSVLRC